MNWIQVFTIVVSVFGLFLWSRRESATEIREIRKEHKDFQRDMKEIHNKIAKIEAKSEERFARLDERYQNFVTSLFAQFTKEDLMKATKETGLK